MEILEKVEQLKAELDSLRPLDAEVEARIWQKFRLDWNYHSNKLEGNSYSFGETKMLLLKGLTAGGKPIRDHEEISGHDEAINVIIDYIKQGEPLTEIFIRQLHKLILVRPFLTDAKTSDGQPTKKLVKVGEYKTEPNHVETQTGAIFYFAEPIETPALMQELIEWFRGRAESSETNVVLIAAEFHYRFVRIHPFDDGNGRLARLLMNFVLMKFGYPPVIIRNEDKDNYIAVLEQADFKILEPFVDYIAQNLIHSLEIMIKGARGEEIEELDDLDKEIALLKQRVKSMGRRIEISKSAEVLLSFFDKTVVPLVPEFSTACERYDDLYLDSDFTLSLSGATNLTLRADQMISHGRRFLEDQKVINQIVFRYVFTNFRQTGFDNFNFESSILLNLEFANYKILNRDGIVLVENLYSEDLSKNEISEIVRHISRLHKDFLEAKLREKLSVTDN